MTTPPAGIIGRETEREAIAGILAGQRPTALTLVGEAGIGKSTLWSFATDLARARGDRVLAWRASDAERDLAFGALSGLFDELDGADLRAIPPPRRRALEVALGRIEGTTDRAGPGLVGLAVLDLVRRLAGQGPVVIALDDVQWLDRPSAGALAFAIRRLRAEPVAIVLAERSVGGAANASTLIEGSLPDERRHRALIGPITVGALGRLIQERTSVVHPRPLLVRIHGASDGNPFVALEMSRSISSRAMAPAPGEPFPVSPEAGPLVRDHLSVLGPNAREAVVVVAVASQPTLDLLERVLGADAGAAVDEACRAGVLIADDDRLRAAHPLFTSIAWADAPPARRRALHRAVADAVEDPLERALHRMATLDADDPDARSELEAGARLALGRGAPALAADFYLRLAATASVADLPRYALAAAAERHRAGDAAGAAILLRDLLPRVAPGRHRAAVLLALAELVYLERPPDALPLLAEALDLSAGDPILEATVHISTAIMSDADPDLGLRSIEAAVAILVRPEVCPDDDLLGAALLERAYQWLLRGERLAVDDIERALRLRAGTGDSFLARSTEERAERILYHAGRLRESLAVDESEYARLQAAGQIGLLPPIVQAMSVLELLIGDWAAARRHARECVDLVEQGETVWRDRAEMARGRVLAWSGQLDEARAIGLAALEREEAAGDTWEAVIFESLLGFIELSVPDPPAALRHLRRADAGAHALEVVLPTVFRYLGDLVEATVLAGELDAAERLLADRLEAPAERIPLPWALLMAARGRGFLAAARGSLDAAVGSYDRALEVLATMPMAFEQARTLLARGQVQLRAGRRRLARADLDAAAAIFGELGAQAWLRRSEAELARIGGRVASRWELTASERSVAGLAPPVGPSSRNREIRGPAGRVVRTVESHLASVYRKLGVRSADAAPRQPDAWCERRATASILRLRPRGAHDLSGVPRMRPIGPHAR